MISANCSRARFSVCGGVGSGAIEGSGHCCAYSFKRLLSSNSYYTGEIQKQICSYIAVCVRDAVVLIPRTTSKG